MSFHCRHCDGCETLTSSTTPAVSEGGQTGPRDEWDWKEAYEAKIREKEQRELASMEITGVSIEDASRTRRIEEAEGELRSSMSRLLWNQKVENQDEGISDRLLLSQATATTLKYLKTKPSSEQTPISPALLAAGEAIEKLESLRPGRSQLVISEIAESRNIGRQQVQSFMDVWRPNVAESEEDD